MPKKLKIMVSSTVYGAESELDSIYGILSGFGYEVIMSREGTLYLPALVSNEEACLKAVEDCEDKGYSKPKWQSRSGFTTFIFDDITVTARTDDTISDAVSDAVNDAINDAIKKGIIYAVSDTVNDALIDTIRTILVADNGVSINEIMRMTGKSNATVKRYLQILRTSKLIEFKGAAKTGRYLITKTALSKISKKQ